MKSIISSLFCLFCFCSMTAQVDRILLDEDFDDWQNVPILESDRIGDNGSSEIDFGRLWLSQDSQTLFLRFEVGTELQFQENNDLTIYIDTDYDAGTGFSIGGIGAELVYTFGERDGTVRLGGNSVFVEHNDVQLISSPTVTAHEFEIQFDRLARFNGLALFPQDSIRLMMRGEGSNPGDQIPDGDGGVTYVFAPRNTDSLPEYSHRKQEEEHLRVLSYNVRRDDLFEPDHQDAFRRILQSIQPDVIGFQEIYNHSSAQTATLMESFMPSDSGEQWYHAKQGPDIIVCSRYPVISSYEIPNSGNGAFLLGLGPAYEDRQMLFISAHTPCCSNNSGRQAEIDAMMGFVRDARDSLVQGLNLPPNSPIVIVGDMNLVGYRQQLKTLIQGDIIDQNSHGPAFAPDWDGSDLVDAKPYATGRPQTATWFSPGSSFSPGRLDFLFYTGSVIELKNSYTLHINGLSDDSLQAHGLLASDAFDASDHLPVVGDFSLPSMSTGFVEQELQEQTWLELYPNPTSGPLHLRYQLPAAGPVHISLHSLRGLEVASLQAGYLSAGQHELTADLPDLAAGIYMLQIKTAWGVIGKKVMVE